MKALVLLALALVACGKKPDANPHPDRKVPVCAQQDCATGQIVDDGCAIVDGKKSCLSCVNACPSYH
jgi:hypothetical protein